MFHSHSFVSMNPLRQLLYLNSTLKCINKVAKKKKKLLKLKINNLYFKLLALKSTHDDYKSLNNKIEIK